MLIPKRNHNEFGRSGSNRMGVGRPGSQKLHETMLRPVKIGGVTALETRTSPRVIMQNLVVLSQTIRAYLQRSAGKFSPSRPASEGHSRSSETTRFDRLPM